MARKMYAIQVSDVRGNWITLKRISALSVDEVLEELQHEKAKRDERAIRAVDGESGQVLLELGTQKEESNVIELAQFTAAEK